MKRTKKILLLEALAIMITAVLFGLITYYVIYSQLAGGHRLMAYVYNIVLIAAILVLDRLLNHCMEKDGFLTQERSRFGHFLAHCLFVTHFISFKTALYLFYIVMLVVSRVSILEPGIIDSHYLSFIYSVEYGVLLLIPLDKFLELLTKDDTRILRILKRIAMV